MGTRTASEPLFTVRLWDGMDGAWCDVTGPISRSEAQLVYDEHTANGTRMTKFQDIDYYRIFPAGTRMVYTHDNEMLR